MNLVSRFLENQDITLKPCVINNKSCIVYPKGLEHSAPEFFAKLRNFVNNNSISLKEDRRKKNVNKHSSERRCWMPVLILSASMLFENTALASAYEAAINLIPQNEVSTEVELRLISKTQNPIQQKSQEKIQKKQFDKTLVLHSQTARNIYEIFKNHYVRQIKDPKYIDSDLKEIANYYSFFPEAITLISSLKQKNWTLIYDKDIWSTIAKGGVLQVNEATIHFNTRSAAKLKLHSSCKENPVCIASPADALLHELLHTQSMLINTEEFISQGGMSTNFYPWKHEFAIIKKENALYASMSKSDTQKRPQRNEHFGRKIVTSCATCIK